MSLFYDKYTIQISLFYYMISHILFIIHFKLTPYSGVHYVLDSIILIYKFT